MNLQPNTLTISETGDSSSVPVVQQQMVYGGIGILTILAVTQLVKAINDLFVTASRNKS